MPTADDIADTIAQTAADGVQSATVDGNSATAISISDLKKARDLTAATEAAAGTNANGGPRSGWGMARQARSIPPGAVAVLIGLLASSPVGAVAGSGFGPVTVGTEQLQNRGEPVFDSPAVHLAAADRTPVFGPVVVDVVKFQDVEVSLAAAHARAAVAGEGGYADTVLQVEFGLDARGAVGAVFQAGPPAAAEPRFNPSPLVGLLSLSAPFALAEPVLRLGPAVTQSEGRLPTSEGDCRLPLFGEARRASPASCAGHPPAVAQAATSPLGSLLGLPVDAGGARFPAGGGRLTAAVTQPGRSTGHHVRSVCGRASRLVGRHAHLHEGWCVKVVNGADNTVHHRHFATANSSGQCREVAE